MRAEGLRGRRDDPLADLSHQGDGGGRPGLHPEPRGPGRQGRPHRHRRVLDGRFRSRPRPPVLRQAGAGARRPGAAAAGARRRLLHRSRARRDAHRGPPPGQGRPDRPHGDDGARGRPPRTRRVRRQPRGRAPVDRPDPGARLRPGAGRHEQDPPSLQRAAPGTRGPCRSDAGGGREAGLPQERPHQGPAQRLDLDGAGAARARPAPTRSASTWCRRTTPAPAPARHRHQGAARGDLRVARRRSRPSSAARPTSSPTATR